MTKSKKRAHGKYYIGLDVSNEKTALCVKNRDGDILRETAVPTHAGDIDKYLKEHFAMKDINVIGLESGQLTIWLYKELEKRGYRVAMMESADVARQMKGAKTDKRDARGIADLLRANMYVSVHVKTTENQKYRTLLGLRERTINARVKACNAIRGSMKDYGLKMGNTSASKYRERIYELLELKPEPLLLEIVEPMLVIMEMTLEQEQRYTKMILDIVKENKVMRRLMTVPGVGPITAFAFVATIDNPLRFSRSRKVGAYIGLVPKTKQSGEIDAKGGITKEGDKILRSLLVEAASSMMFSVKSLNTVSAWGLNICKRRETTRIAICAMARRMASIMHRMMLNETDFIPTKGQLAAMVDEANTASA